MALTQSVVDLVTARTAGRRVTRVRLQVGALSGVVPDAMAFCFELATAGTALEGAELVIDQPAGRVRCHDCGQESDLPDLVRLCPCGSADVEIVAGQELALDGVEVVREDACV